MRVNVRKVIDCSAITAQECSDRALADLGHGPTFALKADTPQDTVHGSVTISHNMPPEAHEIIVDVYEVDEAPTAQMVHGHLEGRQTTIKRPDPMPTEQTIKDRLTKWEEL